MDGEGGDRRRRRARAPMTIERKARKGMSEVVVAGRFDLQGRLMKGFEKIDAILERLEKEGDPDRQMAAIAEHRKHVALAEKVLQTAIRAEAAAEFQAFVLEALEGAGVRVRRRIMGLFEVQSQE